MILLFLAKNINIKTIELIDDYRLQNKKNNIMANVLLPLSSAGFLAHFHSTPENRKWLLLFLQKLVQLVNRT